MYFFVELGAQASGYWQLFIQSFVEYWNYLYGEITNPSWHNYFYWLIGVSVFFYGLELIAPYREKNKFLKRDFWLDSFYMFFNFFLFSLVGFYAISNVFTEFFNDLLASFGITNWVALTIADWPVLVQLLALFVLRDFIQWNVHRFLHYNPHLWEFHKVHHSVTELGFASHLRFHWMETVVYRSLEYIPLGMIGFGIDDFFAVHILALSIGHFAHSNLDVSIGPLRYIFNNPRFHVWHHARSFPGKHGVNFALSLSLWDWLFGTAYLPADRKATDLGIPDGKNFPQGFWGQISYPFLSSQGDD